MLNGDGRGGWSILAGVLGSEVALKLEGAEPMLGPVSAAWLTLQAHQLRDRARMKGALSVRGGSASLEASVDEAHFILWWLESNGPAGDPGPAALRLLAPRAMQAERGAGESGPSLQIRVPAASLLE